MKSSRRHNANMTMVVKGIQGMLSLIESLSITGSYPNSDWIRTDLIPALTTMVKRVGTVEEGLARNNYGDLFLWIIVSLHLCLSVFCVLVLTRKLSRTGQSVKTVSRGVLRLGSKVGVEPTETFPDLS